MNIFEWARPVAAGSFQAGVTQSAPEMGERARGTLVYIAAGQGEWSIGPWKGPLRAGTWLAVPSGELFLAHAAPQPPLAYFYAAFDLPGTAPELAHAQLTWPWEIGSPAPAVPSASEACKPEVVVLFRQLMHELRRPNRPGASLAARSHLAVLGVIFVRLLQQQNRVGARRSTRMLAPSRRIPEPLALLLDFLDANLDRELALPDLARAARYSERRLVQLCRKYLGASPMAYVRERRVKEAQRLLSNGLSVKETAARLNFADAQHLSRVFRQVTGITPTEFGAGMLPRQRESGTYAPTAR